MPSYVPNYPPNYGSMMQYFSQTPPLSSTPTGDANVSRETEFPEFSTQIALGGMSGASELIPDANADESAQARRRILSGPPIKTWCYLVDGLNMEQTSLLAGTRKAKHTGVKFLSTVMSIAHLILAVMELRAEIISTI